MGNGQSTSPSKSPDEPGKIEKQAIEVEKSPQKPVEIGGPKGLEPTRYGDWEKAGRCTDF